MKLKLFLFLSFICLCTVVSSKVDIKDLELMGEFCDDMRPRSAILPAVRAEQTDHAVVLTFNRVVGDLKIVVSTENETVAYATSLTVTGATQFSVYTGDLEAGTYTIEIIQIAQSGGRVYGVFDIE